MVGRLELYAAIAFAADSVTTVHNLQANSLQKDPYRLAWLPLALQDDSATFSIAVMVWTTFSSGKPDTSFT